MTDILQFADEETVSNSNPPWKVLVVDDEDSVHQVTRLVLRNALFDERPIELLEARSASQAKALLEDDGANIALALIDVVMETDHAGLELIQHIRDDMQNHFTRIVLRTGQPGQAPEEQVIQTYDINDYKDKTELTGTKLKTLVYSSLRSFRDIMTIDRQRTALATALGAVGQISNVRSLEHLAAKVFEQVSHLLTCAPSAIYCVNHQGYRTASFYSVMAEPQALQQNMPSLKRNHIMHYDADSLPQELKVVFDNVLAAKRSMHIDSGYVAYHEGISGADSMLYVKHDCSLDEHSQALLEIFSSDAIATYHTLLLADEIQKAQEELIYILGEAVEKRSKETGAHVKRVAEISALLAQLCGTNQLFVENIRLASPLHDLGKIAIPDAILNKPGKLDDAEWELMKTHAEIGASMLASSERPVFRLASRIAGSHHEKWDGSGYPQGLKGREIPLSGRITALADVFDALNSKRCYKEVWPLEQTLEHIHAQKGKHFDPELVDLFMANIDEIVDICNNHPD